MNPVIATLHNALTDRWHPILFVESPLPGGAIPLRHKSKGHHTAGFDTKVAADHYSATELSSQAGGAEFMPEVIFEFFNQPVTTAE